MRVPPIGFALLLVTVSAFGGQSAVDDFRWNDHGRTLALHGDGARVVVTAASPAPFLGLRAGDVLVAVDGHPLHAVGALMQALRRSTAPVVRLRVARGGAQRDVVWTRAEYGALLPPPPPAPPTPPPPPRF